MTRLCILMVVLLGVLGLFGCRGAEDDAEKSQCDITPAGRVELPKDDGRHSDEPIEWWYWTGHLKTAEGRRFGFELAFFAAELIPGQSGQMVHFAVTDIDADTFHYDSQVLAGEALAVENGFQFAMLPQTAVGGNGRDTLHGEADDYVLDLSLESTKPAVLQHGDGFTEYAFGGYTYYYSRERMAAAGAIRVGGQTLEVTGTAWFDHQWGELGQVTDTGWDWFALQFDDDTEMMLYTLRPEGGDVNLGGSITDTDCQTTELGPEDLKITSLGEWTSPDSGCTYPLGWTVEFGGQGYTVTPVLEDQELYSVAPAPKYWEGAATVSGDKTGRAYIELVGYCD
ncbi:MAG TPA: lipocalin-like domain-containing protein [Dehalococcoidia bacterium]|nr:lipocalin-like domain-containing protein [Dehalococcoidia bacterium]